MIDPDPRERAAGSQAEIGQLRFRDPESPSMGPATHDAAMQQEPNTAPQTGNPKAALHFRGRRLSSQMPHQSMSAANDER
jgi:hypothetical protein